MEAHEHLTMRSRPAPWLAAHLLRYTAAVMSFTPSSVIAPAAAFACMGMTLPAFTRAMGARMMITITTAAT
jgi:hypothetical protein